MEKLDIGPPSATVRAEFTPTAMFVEVTGHASLEQGKNLVKDTLELARKRGVQGVLIDLLQVRIDKSPGLGERYFMVREWVDAARGTLRVALAVRSELIDPQKFGVLAARNAGLIGDVFPSREQARAWLDAALSGTAPPPAS